MIDRERLIWDLFGIERAVKSGVTIDALSAKLRPVLELTVNHLRGNNDASYRPACNGRLELTIREFKASENGDQVAADPETG